MSFAGRGGRSTSPSRIPVKGTRQNSPGLPPSASGTPKLKAAVTYSKKKCDDDADVEIVAVTRSSKRLQVPASKGHPALSRLRSASPFTDSDGSASPSPQSVVKKTPIRTTMNIIKQVQKQKQEERLKAAVGVKRKGGPTGPSPASLRQSWVERNFPETLNDLFIHAKKAKDVVDWMKGALGVDDSGAGKGRSKASIALLTGPCGCGKTATLSLVAKELDCEVKEWINRMSVTDFNANRMTKWEAGDEVQGQSQYDVFTSFLFKASTYNALPFKGRHQYKHKLVLVEDFPNLFYRDHAMFHSLLRLYMEEGMCPLVFIIPDNSSSDASTFRLFPKNLIQELNITTISFNPVAATFMTKFLQNVCSKEGVTPDDNLIDSVVVGCGGDIRCAINTLQFKLMNEDFRESGSSKDFKVPRKGRAALTKKKLKKGEPVSGAVEKDETLFLYRALGKVLNANRDRTLIVDDERKVPRCAWPCVRRNPLEDNVEEFVKRIEGSADTFLGFLQQNYVPFFGDMDDIVSAASYLADSEYILSSWPFDDSGVRSYKEKEAKEEVTLLIAARGMMYSNVHPPPKKWRPLRKPMFGDVRSKLEKSSETIHNLVFENQPILQSFCLENIPFYSKLLRKYPRRWPTDQANVIRDIGTFKKGFSNRNVNETQLTERDVAIEGEDLDGEETSRIEPTVRYKVERKTVAVNTCEEEDSPEDLLIEEYDTD